MNLSVLDFFANPRQVLDLASVAERSGYHRFWVGEHHQRTQCANPLMLSGLIAGFTNFIRVGTGAMSVVLRHPYLAAEDARLNRYLYGDRFDLGAAPATNGPPELIGAIAEHWPLSAASYADRLRRLHAYVTGRVPADDPLGGFGYLDAGPPVWILGLSDASAALAAELGTGFCTSFHHSASVAQVSTAIARYQSAFRPSPEFPAPRAMVVVSGLISESSSPEQLRQRYYSVAQIPRLEVDLFGRAQDAADRLKALAQRVRADELMFLSLAVSDIVPRNTEMFESLGSAWGLPSRSGLTTAMTEE